MFAANQQIRYPGETDNHFRQRCRRGYRDCGEAYHLFRFKWQIFGHVTFAQVEISRHKRVSMLFAAIASTFDGHGLQFKHAVWVRCEEEGKLGRAVPHIHFLIARLPKHVDIAEFCQHLGSEWRRVGGLRRHEWRRPGLPWPRHELGGTRRRGVARRPGRW